MRISREAMVKKLYYIRYLMYWNLGLQHLGWSVVNGNHGPNGSPDTGC